MPPKRKTNTDQLSLAWQPQVGDRVTVGTEVLYSITRVSMDGRQVDLQIPGTNIERFRVSVDNLTPKDSVRQSERISSKPSKPQINIEDIRERIANAQQSSVDQFSGDIAILKKYFKSKGITQDALDELDSLCEDMEKRWNAAVETISDMLGDE